jgi:hypothetical protein
MLAQTAKERIEYCPTCCVLYILCRSQEEKPRQATSWYPTPTNSDTFFLKKTSFVQKYFA